MRYFDHDTTAGSDDKIMALRLEHGSAAIDAYWTLLEKIYRDESPINLDWLNMETKAVCHRLSIRFEDLEKYVKTMLELGLFVGTISEFTSERAESNIEAYHRKQETARQNGKDGGRKPTRKPTQKPTLVSSENQGSCKKRKENKGVGGKLNPPNATACGGAGEEEPAPQAEYVPCPEELKPIFGFVDRTVVSA